VSRAKLWHWSQPGKRRPILARTRSTRRRSAMGGRIAISGPHQAGLNADELGRVIARFGAYENDLSTPGPSVVASAHRSLRGSHTSGYRLCRVGALVARLLRRRRGRATGRVRSAVDRRDTDIVRVVRLGPLLRRGRNRGPDIRRPERRGHRRVVCVAEGLHRPARPVRGRGFRPRGKRCGHDRPEISDVSGAGRHKGRFGLGSTVKRRRMGDRHGG
jgi:hypothetical protein